MGSSGGSGGGAPPRQPTPSGNLVPYGGTSAPSGWAPSAAVLPSTGEPMTMEMMARQWQNPSFAAPPPPPQPAGGGMMDPGAMKAMLAQMMSGQRYGNALRQASQESQRGSPGIQSFGTLRNILNPDFTPQQRQNIARTTSMNRSAR